MKRKIKNFSLHPLKLNNELQKEYEIIEPNLDKKELVIETEDIVQGKCTMGDEQHRIIGIINDSIESGDVLYVAGHPALVLAISTVAQIKGATVVTCMLNQSKEVIKIEELITNCNQLDRKHRLELEWR